MADINTLKTILTFPILGVNYNVTFDYLARKFVVVTLIGADRKLLVVGTDYKFVSKTQITLLTAVPSGYTQIEVRRFTDANDRLVDFQDGSILRATDLNVAQIQTMHIAEEGRDVAGNTMGTDANGNLDARNRKLVNLVDGVDPSDAVTVRQETAWGDSAKNQANAAAASAAAAHTSEVNASNSAAAALASQGAAATSAQAANNERLTAQQAATSANASAQSASTSENNASTSEGHAKTSETNAAASASQAHNSELGAASEAAKLKDFNDFMGVSEFKPKDPANPKTVNMFKTEGWYQAHNSYPAIPANGSPLAGGAFQSECFVTGENLDWDSRAAFQTYHLTGNSYGSALVQSALNGNGTYANFWFHSTGILELPSSSSGAQSTGIVGPGGIETGGEAKANGSIVQFPGGKIKLMGSNVATTTQGYIGFANHGGSLYGAAYSERAGDFTIMVDGQGTPKYFQLLKDGSLSVPSNIECNGSVSLNAGRIRFNTPVETPGGNVAGTGMGGYIEANILGKSRGIGFWTSDATLKERIKPIPYGTTGEKLDRIRPVSFKFKDTVWTPEGGETEVYEGKEYGYGVLAQEIEKIMPETVTTLSDGTKSLDALAVVGFLLAAVKDQRADIKALQDKLEAMK